MPDTPTNEHWRIEDYLAYLLARASHRISSEFHREIRNRGLTIMEWRVLATLADGSTRPVGELAVIVLAKQPTLTKLLDRMQQARMITRTSGESDRRQSLVSITSGGRNALGDLLERSKLHEQSAYAGLNPTEARVLKSTLRKLIEDRRKF